MKKLLLIFVVFLAVGAYMIKTAQDMQGVQTYSKTDFLIEYGKWLFRVGGNVKDVTGYAVNRQWLPQVNMTANKTDGNLSDVIEDKAYEIGAD